MSQSFETSASTRLTVYSGDFESVAQADVQPGGSGFALVEQDLKRKVNAGSDLLRIDGLPRAIDASSVVLKPTGSTRIQGQRFDFAIADQSALLARAVGKAVSVEQSIGNERRSYSGTLLAAGNGLTLRLADGRIRVLSSFESFELEQLPEGLVSEPTLNFQVAAERSGEQAFTLNYATAGLAWRAEYNATLQGQGKNCQMSFAGAAMIANRSGTTFNDAMLTLVAGEPNRTSGGAIRSRSKSAMVERAMIAADSAPSAEASGEYQAYKLPNAGSLPDSSVQRVPLVDTVSGVACERQYIVRGSIGEWIPDVPVIDRNFGLLQGEQPIVAGLKFRNDKAAGLGMPLPAGRVRMFEGSNFLGEAMLGHTAAGREVELDMGKSFDLSAERKRESFSLDRSGQTMTETIAVTLRNAKASEVAIRVDEQLPRWSEWEITESTVKHSKLDAQRVGFDVSVPANGEKTLRYTVRYRWAANIKLQE